MENIYTKENLKCWQGIRDFDTGEINYGYLWFWKDKTKSSTIGRSISGVKNEEEAIEKFFNEENN